MADSIQKIVLKYEVDATDLKQAERELDNLTTDEKKLKNQAQQTGKALDGNAKSIRTVNKELGKTEQELKQINNQTKKTSKGIGGVTNSLKGLGTALIGAFAIEKIIEYTKAFAQLENQIAQTRGTIQRFSKTQGETLDNLTARVRALASTYGIAEERLIDVVNAFSKQSGADFVDSLTLIEKGYIQVGNASGEFSNSISEYTKLLIQAGATAEEVVKIAAIQDLEGVFNDKLIDTIFNFSNELKDSKKAMRALSNTFGVEFAQKAVGDFNAGTATALDILQRVGKEAERTGKSTQDLAEITTDLGTGVAEDLGGIREAYRLYNKALDLNINSLDTLGKRQKEVLRVSQDYEASLVQLASNFDGFGASVEKSTKQTIQFFTELVNGMFEAQKIYDQVNGNIKTETQSLQDFVNSLSFDQLGDEIESTQANINKYASSILSLRGNYNSVLLAGEKAGESTKDYKDRLKGLSDELLNTKVLFSDAKEKLDLLIKAKDEGRAMTERLTEATAKEAKIVKTEVGTIASLRLKIAEVTKAREGAVSEASIIRLNKRLKLLQDELSSLLRLKDATEKSTVAEVERLNVGNQVSDDLLNKQLTNIEELDQAQAESVEIFKATEQEKLLAVANTASQLGTEIANFRSAQIDAELQQLSLATQERIRLAGDNAQAIESIQADAAKKEQALLEKQSNIRKNAQIQQAIIAGIEGVVQATARADLFPFNFVLAGLIAATTAGQVATIKATPAFKDGTEYVEGKGTGTSDSINARLSKGERVVDAKTNTSLKGISNDDLPKAVNAWTNLKSFMPAQVELASNANSSTDVRAVAEAIKEGFSGATVNEQNYNEQGFSRYQRSKGDRVRIIDKNNSL